MSEVTPQKRVLPARERHGSTSKRRASSLAAPSSPPPEPRQKRKYTKRASLNKPATPATATPAPSSSAGGALPTKLQASKPLPTTAIKQEKPSNRDYQSIADSAVLAASLHQSRMQWLCEGIFQRYWTKPVKRKGVIEQPPGNPDAKSMQKLGNATMTIEPHTFDVTFYTVKEFGSAYQRHPNQHTAKQALPAPTPAPVVQTLPAKPATSATATGSTPTQTLAPSDSNHAQKQNPLPKDDIGSTSAAPLSTPAPVRTSSNITPANVPPKPTGDPVIQMLAARAATDNRLKELMKVVAMSQATPDQLKEFQAHIDEFNKIIKQQEARKAESDKSQATPAPAPAVTHSSPNNTAPSRPTNPAQPARLGAPVHTSSPLSQPVHVQPRTDTFIKHIVIEFHSAPSVSQNASTDRWLFPQHAVLDIKTGGMEMLASFFVERAGKDILKTRGLDEEGSETSIQKFKSDTEYYQPVTITIKATQHRTIETIARAAKPLVSCQKYMKEVMEKKTRAPQEYLVLCLPKEHMLTDSNPAPFVDSAVEMSNDEDDELRPFYGL